MSDSNALPPLGPETAELYLAPYLDGALSRAEIAQFETLLASDPDLAALKEGMTGCDDALSGAFDQMLNAPVPLALLRAASQPVERAPVAAPPPQESTPPPPAQPANLPGPPGWLPRLAVAAVLAGLLVAMPFVYRAGQTQGVQVAALDTGWLSQIASYHRLYTSDPATLVEFPADEDQLAARLGDWLGTRFDIPDLSDEGLEFAGGRMLVAAGRPVAQLMFTQADGRPVALCLMAAEIDATGQTQVARGDLTLEIRRRDGLAHVLVGWDDPARMAQIADISVLET